MNTVHFGHEKSVKSQEYVNLEFWVARMNIFLTNQHFYLFLTLTFKTFDFPTDRDKATSLYSAVLCLVTVLIRQLASPANTIR